MKREPRLKQRVNVVKGCGLIAMEGIVGTVVVTGEERTINDVLVEFDKNVGGHEGMSVGFEGKKGSCWWLAPSELNIAKENENVAENNFLEHWQEMITTVEEHMHLGDEPSTDEMMKEIGVSWEGEYCSLCAKYSAKKCIDCPVKILGSRCGKDSIWWNVTTASTWAMWLHHAYEMVEMLKRVKQWQAENQTYSVGYEFKDDGDTCMLVSAGLNRVTAVVISEGTYKGQCVAKTLTKVKDVEDITGKELARILGESHSEC